MPGLGGFLYRNRYPRVGRAAADGAVSFWRSRAQVPAGLPELPGLAPSRRSVTPFSAGVCTRLPTPATGLELARNIVMWTGSNAS